MPASSGINRPLSADVRAGVLACEPAASDTDGALGGLGADDGAPLVTGAGGVEAAGDVGALLARLLLGDGEGAAPTSGGGGTSDVTRPVWASTSTAARLV